MSVYITTCKNKWSKEFPLSALINTRMWHEHIWMLLLCQFNFISKSILFQNLWFQKKLNEFRCTASINLQFA